MRTARKASSSAPGSNAAADTANLSRGVRQPGLANRRHCHP